MPSSKLGDREQWGTVGVDGEDDLAEELAELRELLPKRDDWEADLDPWLEEVVAEVDPFASEELRHLIAVLEHERRTEFEAREQAERRASMARRQIEARPASGLVIGSTELSGAETAAVGAGVFVLGVATGRSL